MDPISRSAPKIPDVIGPTMSLESDCSAASLSRTRRHSVDISSPTCNRRVPTPVDNMHSCSGRTGDWMAISGGAASGAPNTRTVRVKMGASGGGNARTAVRIAMNKNETHAMLEKHSPSGPGKSNVYRLTTSELTTPNGARQRVSTLEDTKMGLKQMSFGRQIGDRFHTVEKSHNRITGEATVKEESVNIVESDDFEREWKARTGIAKP
ncbi:myeloid leukemia factor 2-like [Ornithodoros turicata]|uniref:myeloid leukemia factor 2-like n=1 Tax=Ornithodoros turicata TaxID=34597 RepID=UPI003138BCC4